MNSSTRAIPLAVMASLALLLLLVQSSEAVISCSDVIKDLSPCVTYLKSGSGKPPAACCAGASALVSAAGTTADKQAACNCLKSASKSINPQPALAQALPGNCGLSLPFPISTSVDCTKIT